MCASVNQPGSPACVHMCAGRPPAGGGPRVPPRPPRQPAAPRPQPPHGGRQCDHGTCVAQQIASSCVTKGRSACLCNLCSRAEVALVRGHMCGPVMGLAAVLRYVMCAAWAVLCTATVPVMPRCSLLAGLLGLVDGGSRGKVLEDLRLLQQELQPGLAPPRLRRAARTVNG